MFVGGYIWDQFHLKTHARKTHLSYHFISCQPFWRDLEIYRVSRKFTKGDRWPPNSRNHSNSGQSCPCLEFLNTFVQWTIVKEDFCPRRILSKGDISPRILLSKEAFRHDKLAQIIFGQGDKCLGGQMSGGTNVWGDRCPLKYLIFTHFTCLWLMTESHSVFLSCINI